MLTEHETKEEVMVIIEDFTKYVKCIPTITLFFFLSVVIFEQLNKIVREHFLRKSMTGSHPFVVTDTKRGLG